MGQHRTFAIVVSCLALASCQSSGQSQPSGQDAASAAGAPPAAAAVLAAAAPGQCTRPISGPPPKPAKGSDFAAATGKNLGKNVGRNLMASMGSRVAGPLGGVVVGAVATDAIRTEQDLKGAWNATDGAATCGCTLDVKSGINLQGRTVYNGSLQARDCANPHLARVAKWNLGHTFTGYDATLDLTASDGTQLASLKRDGMDYFSGTLADGTPLTIWRD